jgi:uncharacterized membrane protein
MSLDLLLDAFFSSAGLPARVSRSFVAVAMLVAGLAFLALAIFMTVEAINLRAWSTLLFAGLFVALSSVSFWLMYRAARERGGASDEA